MRLFCAAALIVGFALLLGCGSSGKCDTSTPSGGVGMAVEAVKSRLLRLCLSRTLIPALCRASPSIQIRGH